ncbi:MAG: CDP-diacylglycerol--glycerol-3-phosphate 3-phosphatidyltransferase [Bacteroidetes bacterium]|nr:CDP-diacylglycerol--glycerol-3-phosphate 3-phosphatidyltransferase [Bacteroidota bacterium]MBU1678203.1 CDP-diacylglycerol--glycerol-3-phosphate 3-phosphatidyltransferase [Bacteroidota bacterium]
MILPNQLTVLRIILTPVFMVLFLSDDPFYIQISMGVYIVAAITDWYDGWLARKFNYITTWGKFLDPLADKILTSAAFIAFVVLGALELWMVIIIVIRDFFITGIRAYAEYHHLNFATSRSAKWKTFYQMTFIYYLLVFYTLKTISYIPKDIQEILILFIDKSIVYWLMLGVTILTFITGIQYIIKNRKLIKDLFNFATK